MNKEQLYAAQTAMIATIGIFEDSAKKLTGEKSLTKVTQDYNGQYAFGLMNWIPSDANSYLGYLFSFVHSSNVNKLTWHLTYDKPLEYTTTIVAVTTKFTRWRRSALAKILYKEM